MIEILQYSYYPTSFQENLSYNQNLFSTLQRSYMFHDFLFQCEDATVLKLQHLSLVAIFILFLCGRYIVWPVNVDTFNFHIRIVQSSWKKSAILNDLIFFLNHPYRNVHPNVYCVYQYWYRNFLILTIYILNSIV